MLTRMPTVPRKSVPRVSGVLPDTMSTPTACEGGAGGRALPSSPLFFASSSCFCSSATASSNSAASVGDVSVGMTSSGGVSTGGVSGFGGSGGSGFGGSGFFSSISPEEPSSGRSTTSISCTAKGSPSKSSSGSARASPSQTKKCRKIAATTVVRQ